MYLLLDCSDTNTNNSGVPVGLYLDITGAEIHIDLLCMDRGEEVREGYCVVEMEVGCHYASDELTLTPM